MFRSLIKAPVNILSKYNRSLLNSPYKTKMATAGVTYFIADCIAQKKIEKKNSEEYSLLRSSRQSAVGAFFAAPSLHVWHSLILPKIVKHCTKNITRILVSVFLNESILAAYFVSCLLFSFESLKKMSVEAGAQNVKDKFVPAMETSVKFWTGISFINYGLVPIQFRPVFVSCWSIVWQSYLSYISNNKVTQLPTVISVEDRDRQEEVEFQAILSQTLPSLG